jgi:phosphate transport system ATP-binding protein
MSNVKIEVKDLNLYYGNFHALKNINFKAYPNTVSAFIGPSGCGKSTLLRVFNRMNDLIDGVKVFGKTHIDGENIYKKNLDVDELRKRIGMVFQKPNPFPKSIFENVAYGLRVNGISDKHYITEQQQRLCIARTLAIKPSIILMDEPASALDPISTAKIEDLIYELKKDYTIVIVTHNMQQAGRVSDYTAFFYLGELVEWNETKVIFTSPTDVKTQNYVTGRFG